MRAIAAAKGVGRRHTPSGSVSGLVDLTLAAWVLLEVRCDPGAHASGDDPMPQMQQMGSQPAPSVRAFVLCASARGSAGSSFGVGLSRNE